MRAARNGMCANQLVGFLAATSADDQVRVGLGWMGKLVLSYPERATRSAVLVPGWLIDVRSAADNCGCLKTWQAVVDALVVAEVRHWARIATLTEKAKMNGSTLRPNSRPLSKPSPMAIRPRRSINCYPGPLRQSQAESQVVPTLRF